MPVPPAPSPGKGSGHDLETGRERIVPAGRVNADGFRDLAKALLAFARARERGESVSAVRIDAVVAAYLVEIRIRYEKAGGKISLDQIMQLGNDPPAPEA